jgi:class 3 adenylate cyclase
LLLKGGPLAGQRVEVASELLVGRVDADVTIDDPLVSRRHALVRPAAGGLEIEDLGSMNGTWVNGERITGVRRLAGGDLVNIGTTSIEVEVGPAAQHTLLAPAGLPLSEHIAATEAPPAAPAVRAERPREIEPLLEGDELRPVTALFADIVGSTGLGERLAPDEVQALIGECVSRMTRAVEQYGGTVGSYMGDGIAAFFGIPTAHEDDPERAARAALRILDELGEYAREVETAWGISNFNARVGINTGPTSVGLVGAADPQAVSLGDTNNVAARLQGVAEPGTIAIGDATARALVNQFILEPLGDVAVKGRVQPVAAWRLVGVQRDVYEATPTPLVGRDAELQRLRRIVDELAAGRGQILFLLGEGGIGKTRLLAELRSIAGTRVTWLDGRCYSYGTRLLYGPFIQMLRTWVGIDEGEAELSVRAKLRAKFGLLPKSQVPDALPSLARLLSVRLDPESDERLRLLPPDALAAEIRAAFKNWVASLARQGPVVVAVEDLHWADPPSCELAEELLELVDLAPILVVATSRMDPASDGWRLRVQALSHYVHRAVELPLAPLSEPSARALLAGLPPSAKLSEAELDHIVAGAEGNPLYLEELCNAFTAGGPRRQQLTWAPTMAGARVLTPTLESLLLARIDRLPRRSRRLAQVAAVIGRSFPLRVLENVAETEDVEGDLAALLRADIIREVQRYPEPEFTFRHGLLREASLAALPAARRRELYTAVGLAFERLFATALDDHLEVLAHYFGRSDDLQKGLQYLERAGERASELDAVPRAAELWERGAKLAERLGNDESERRLRARLAELDSRTQDRAPSPHSDAGLARDPGSPG